jgi:hypothetical protein
MKPGEGQHVETVTNEPSLCAELEGVLGSTDRVNLRCAFVRWHGLRVLKEELDRSPTRWRRR